MTRLLELAVERLQQLADTEQDSIAALILEELDSEQRWRAAFTASPDQFATLAQDALAEYRAGRTQELNLDTR